MPNGREGIGMSALPTLDTSPLFRPFKMGEFTLRNRVVMAPMTRAFSPSGVPGENVARYYARRAEGGVGLIVTEGTWIDHPAASNDPNIPCFYGEDALRGWDEVRKRVQSAGARIVPQLWHVGAAGKSEVGEIFEDRLSVDEEQIGPSGLLRESVPTGRAMTQSDIDAVGDAYVRSAESAYRLGFDGVELHGAHGYLLDQFAWGETNRRTDRYGGGIAERARFTAEIVSAIKKRTAPGFPVLLRYSQWKMQDYAARAWPMAHDLERFLAPLVDAGVDIFHCSQRRFWLPEFPDSNLNLAGWTRKLTGRPTITVGSVTMTHDFIATIFDGKTGRTSGLGELVERLGRDEFDLVAIGRALIMNPDWAQKIQANRLEELTPFSADVLTKLE
jgi:2,4-dienoyl-CoA reductase-like NADH-dependent reductase (Old Yellow Enzyme family)